MNDDSHNDFQEHADPLDLAYQAAERELEEVRLRVDKQRRLLERKRELEKAKMEERLLLGKDADDAVADETSEAPPPPNPYARAGTERVFDFSEMPTQTAAIRGTLEKMWEGMVAGFPEEAWLKSQRRQFVDGLAEEIQHCHAWPGNVDRSRQKRTRGYYDAKSVVDSLNIRYGTDFKMPVADKK